MSKKIYLNEEAAPILKKLADEYAVVKNPAYVFPEVDIYPLAPKIKNTDRLIAAVMDMDGTTTTTEELCIHSLEYMIRGMSDKMTPGKWDGLDHLNDYPNIIGNSTTKHVEYLIERYSGMIDEEAVLNSYCDAVNWTLQNGKDSRRSEEVKDNLIHFNLGDVPLNPRTMKVGPRNLNFASLVRMGIDIYYKRYHEILELIRSGRSDAVIEDVFKGEARNLIEPMPGVEIFLPLVKGWLGEESGSLGGYLIDSYGTKFNEIGKNIHPDQISSLLKKLGSYFNVYPLKLSIVTSSIRYEADIVMNEVFKVLRGKISLLPLSSERKDFIIEKFSGSSGVYDAFVTASDSSEIRLKPHRDLYSIALHKLGIGTSDFNKVVGFEDSESGCIAIRASGIGLCIAVPFAQTSGHSLESASYVCRGGLPEVILSHKLFLNIH